MSELYLIKCGWGETKARLLYKQDSVYYWKAINGFKFISNDLKDVTEL